MLRSLNCGGALRRACSIILGVPGGRHGDDSTGIAVHQRGRARPASSATFSAIAARRASSSMFPLRGGGVAIAASTPCGCERSQSTNARRRVQLIFGPTVEGLHTSARAAIDRRLGIGSSSRLTCWPAAEIMRCSIVMVGSTSPSSTRETVEMGTPARRATTASRHTSRLSGLVQEGGGRLHGGSISATIRATWRRAAGPSGRVIFRTVAQRTTAHDADQRVSAHSRRFQAAARPRELAKTTRFQVERTTADRVSAGQATLQRGDM